MTDINPDTNPMVKYHQDYMKAINECNGNVQEAVEAEVVYLLRSWAYIDNMLKTTETFLKTDPQIQAICNSNSNAVLAIGVLESALTSSDHIRKMAEMPFSDPNQNKENDDHGT